MKPRLRAALIALVVATLLFRRQILLYAAPQLRYLSIWSHTDAAIMVGLILLVAAIGYGIYELVRLINKPVVTNLAGHLFVAVLVMATLSQFQKVVLLKAQWQYLWMSGLLVALTVSALRPRWRVVHHLGTVCAILSPLAIYTIGQIPFWKTWYHPRETYVPAVDKPGSTPVFIFSFDALGWIYLRDSDRTDVKKILPHFREFGHQAYRFSQARSSAPRTGLSLPMMAYQINAGFKVPQIISSSKPITGPSFIIDGKPVLTTKLDSMFAVAEDAGYQTSFVTFYLPWREILGRQCNYVQVYDREPYGNNFWERCFYTLFRNLRFYPFPNNIKITDRWMARYFSDHWADINFKMQADAEHIIKVSPSNTLSFFHFPLPHAPYIWSADGKYMGPYKFHRMSGDASDYMRSVRTADIVFGRIVEQLKAAGKYDNALIILTSDHGWDVNTKTREQRYEPLHHNTLMIKLPGQAKGAVISDPVANTSLGPIIEMALHGKLTGEAFTTAMAKAVIPPERLERKFSRFGAKANDDDAGL